MLWYFIIFFKLIFNTVMLNEIIYSNMKHLNISNFRWILIYIFALVVMEKVGKSEGRRVDDLYGLSKAKLKINIHCVIKNF